MRFRITMWAATAVLISACVAGCDSADITQIKKPAVQGHAEALGGAEHGAPETQDEVTRTENAPSKQSDELEGFRNSAEQSYANEQYELGCNYWNGEGVDEDRDEAAKCFTKAAELGHEKAQGVLGFMNRADTLDSLRGLDKDDAEALKWYTAAAAQGNILAQYNLGVMYTSARGIAENYVEAIKWYTKAAEQGHTRSRVNLGVMYSSDSGVEKDDEQAYLWFSLAAGENSYAKGRRDALEAELSPDAVAQAKRRAAEITSSIGTQGADVQDWLADINESQAVVVSSAEFTELMREGAERGIADDQYRLGSYYAEGSGVEKDTKEAVVWYRKAAEQGHPEAQSSLGDCYTWGEGVEKDYAEAIKWYTASAEQGNDAAQIGLAAMYASGIGVEKDTVKAYMWLSLAADENSYLSEERDNLGAELSKDEINDAQRRVAEFNPLVGSANQGHADAQLSLGDYYYKGEGVEKNYAEAIKWYTAAAEQGEIEAQVRLGWMLANGEGVEIDDAGAARWYKLADTHYAGEPGWALMNWARNRVDDAEAVKWYTAAASVGNVNAQLDLGWMYLKGEGVEKSDEAAVRWYKAAAEQGHAGAQLTLGDSYYYGRGADKDYAEAIKWYTAAAKQGKAGAQMNLGIMYAHGEGVTKNAVEAVRWYKVAAEQGNVIAQNNLGAMYWNGEGVAKNAIDAYMWLNLAVVNSSPSADFRDKISEEMTRDQVAEAQKRSAEFEAVIEGAESEASPRREPASPEANVQVKATGTAFMVDNAGYAVTAAHVVADAARIEVVSGAERFTAAIVFMDAANDVAVIKAEGTFSAIPVGSSRYAKLGTSVFTVGFPNIAIQGTSPKLTKGEINSLAGIQDDPRFFQVSTAIQPGNSGGPLVNEQGEVIGIIISQLDQAVSWETSGSLQQNVNYALKSAYFLPMLESVPGFSLGQKNSEDMATAEFDKAATVAAAATMIVLVY